jgi:DNA-binding NarL/FixJ family response regulator
MIRIGIRMVLDQHPRFVMSGENITPRKAIELVERQRPDIVLIDMDVCDDAEAFIHELQHASEASHIVVLSGLEDEELTRKALMAGAAGVILKIQPPVVLLALMESLCNADTSTVKEAKAVKSFSMASIDQKPMTFVNEKKRDDTSKKIESLTIREREIISLIAMGMRNKDIADHLCISETTVRHHLTNIFGKLEVSDRQKLLILAHHYDLAELKVEFRQRETK